jgi:hypothetical protein
MRAILGRGLPLDAACEPRFVADALCAFPFCLVRIRLILEVPLKRVAPLLRRNRHLRRPALWND